MKISVAEMPSYRAAERTVSEDVIAITSAVDEAGRMSFGWWS